ncbi:hypothetical protein AVEN_59916-1 [Araneus ventricosus]|uniref:Uncharacterized protein n=1 Tax=Araneus ventricosus TaxID=182803 RepID=A0A4Y2EFA1_ARAVE|nr:hypothetical protein AVEN_59916-1 [Araneus ventricosus]
MAEKDQLITIFLHARFPCISARNLLFITCFTHFQKRFSHFQHIQGDGGAVESQSSIETAEISLGTSIHIRKSSARMDWTIANAALFR